MHNCACVQAVAEAETALNEAWQAEVDRVQVRSRPDVHILSCQRVVSAQRDQSL